jgi:hypothetical protein
VNSIAAKPSSSRIRSSSVKIVTEVLSSMGSRAPEMAPRRASNGQRCSNSGDFEACSWRALRSQRNAYRSAALSSALEGGS